MSRDWRVDDSETQMLVLALAELSLSRPGWEYAIRLLVRRQGTLFEEMFDRLRFTSKDRVRESHADVLGRHRPDILAGPEEVEGMGEPEFKRVAVGLPKSDPAIDRGPPLPIKRVKMPRRPRARTVRASQLPDEAVSTPRDGKL